MKARLYDIILNGYDVDGFTPEDYARGIPWDEVDFEEVGPDGLPLYRERYAEVDGLTIYYDFGADYYFFVEWV